MVALWKRVSNFVVFFFKFSWGSFAVLHVDLAGGVILRKVKALTSRHPTRPWALRMIGLLALEEVKMGVALEFVALAIPAADDALTVGVREPASASDSAEAPPNVKAGMWGPFRIERRVLGRGGLARCTSRRAPLRVHTEARR